MILLADRNFGAGLPGRADRRGTRADFLIRVKTGYGAPGLPVLSRLPDGSWLSRFGGIPVRVIDAAGHRHHQHRALHERLPAGHHAARPGPLPRPRGRRSLPRALGGRNRLLRAQVHDPRRPGPARPHPGRDRAGGLRTAGRLPGAAHRDRRRRRHRPGHRPRPGQLLRRPEHRPRPGHPRRGHPRRTRHRPGRNNRPARPGQPHARPGGCASAPASSSAPCPGTTPEARSTAQPARPPSPSPSSASPLTPSDEP